MLDFNEFHKFYRLFFRIRFIVLALPHSLRSRIFKAWKFQTKFSSLTNWIKGVTYSGKNSETKVISLRKKMFSTMKRDLKCAVQSYLNAQSPVFPLIVGLTGLMESWQDLRQRLPNQNNLDLSISK